MSCWFVNWFDFALEKCTRTEALVQFFPRKIEWINRPTRHVFLQNTRYSDHLTVQTCNMQLQTDTPTWHDNWAKVRVRTTMSGRLCGDYTCCSKTRLIAGKDKCSCITFTKYCTASQHMIGWCILGLRHMICWDLSCTCIVTSRSERHHQIVLFYLIIQGWFAMLM